MSFTNDQHLNDDQIAQAVVDAQDLPIPLRKHLSECPHCGLAVEQFQKDLSSIGKLANQFSPEPKRRIALPVEKETASFLGSRKWQISFGTAVSAVIVFLMIWWSGMTNPSLNGVSNDRAEELWEDETLMTEISSISNNALPQLYMDITGDFDSEMEDEFMEFINPSDDDTTLT